MRLIRENPEAVARALTDRGGAELIRPLIDQDGLRRRLVRESEDLKALRNKASEAIGQAKRRSEDAAAEQARMREVGEALGLMDFERAGRMSKTRFVVLWGPLARLERALTDFMLDLSTLQHEYTEVWVPHLVNASTMQNNGLLPKFEVGLFKTVEPDEDRTLYLIPTAEVPVTALHTGETLAEPTLPRRYE